MEQQQDAGEETRQLSGGGGPILRTHNHARVWPTVDGPLGLSEEDSLSYARSFFKYGFFLLPWLWAINCFYFWPVLRSDSRSFPHIRRYVVGSAIGFIVCTALLATWALTFAIGGEQLFGPVWGDLVMYNVADRLGLTVALVVPLRQLQYMAHPHRSHHINGLDDPNMAPVVRSKN